MSNPNNNLLQVGQPGKKRLKPAITLFLGFLEIKRNNLTLFVKNAQGETMEVTKFMMFKNESKQKETQPDYRLVVSVE